VNVTVLGATGAIGFELTRQALERGHAVTAVARNPGKLTGRLPASDRLRLVAADVRDPAAVTDALKGSTVVMSGLGIVGDEPGTLTAGARAAVAAGPERVIWIGAFGTGTSAREGGAFLRTLLRVGLRRELDDRVTADRTVLAAGGTVFHCGPFSTGPLSPTRRTVTLAGAPRRYFPARVSQATVAAAMLDEAEQGRYPGATVVPLD
jgi:uncharacterized protein